MNHFSFDLNLYNYTIDELKSLIHLPLNYTDKHIKYNIKNIINKINGLELSSKEVDDIILFLKNIELILKNDMIKKKNEMLKSKVNILEKHQNILKKQLGSIKINEKPLKKNKEKTE